MKIIERAALIAHVNLNVQGRRDPWDMCTTMLRSGAYFPLLLLFTLLSQGPIVYVYVCVCVLFMRLSTFFFLSSPPIFLLLAFASRAPDFSEIRVRFLVVINSEKVKRDGKYFRRGFNCKFRGTSRGNLKEVRLRYLSDGCQASEIDEL